MNNKNFQRYQWIDYAKSIGIFLIVYGHFLAPNKLAFCFIYTFHVPLFFFIAGFLSAKDNKVLDIKKRIERLLLPYIYLYLISLIFLFGMKAIQEHKFYLTTFLQSLIGLFWGNIGYTYFVNVPLWFFPSLLTVELIFSFFIRKNPWLLIIFCLTSIIFCINGVSSIFLSFDSSLLGLNYYCLGYFIRRKNIIVKLQKPPNAVLFILGFTAAFLAVYILAKNGNVWYAGNSVYAYFTSFMGGAIGCLMITAISLLLEQIIGELKPIKFISLNTILILGFHALFSNEWALKILSPFSLRPPPLKKLLATILSIMILVPIIILINKFLPQIGGRRS